MLDIRRVLGANANPRDPAAQNAALWQAVLDLMMEVEALRRAVLAGAGQGKTAESDQDALAADDHGVPGPHTPYGKAYIGAAWLTHCAIGLSGGFDKLLDLYYPRAEPGRAWRERLMLARLGYSKEAIAKFVESASEAEAYT
jgi:hypothetical protein